MGGEDLISHLVLVDYPVDGDLQVQLAHAGEQVLARLLVDLDDEGWVRLGDGPQDLDQLGQVLHVLGLDGHGDHRLGVVGDLLEGLHVLQGGDGGARDRVLQAADGADVARVHLLDGDAVRSDAQSDGLHAIGVASAGDVHLHALDDLAGEQAADGHLASMRVHDDLGDHQGGRSVGVAGEHGLADLALLVPLPDDGDTDLLRLQGVGDVLDDHVQQDLVHRALLGQGLLVVVVAEVVDVLHADAGLLHVRRGDGPVVEGGPEGHGAILDGDLPLLVEGGGQLGRRSCG